jgi:hypothetical protein
MPAPVWLLDMMVPFMMTMLSTYVEPPSPTLAPDPMPAPWLLVALASLTTIGIPRYVEIIGEWCFSECQSLSSMSFKNDSRLD